ncbi:MAG TPA: glycoside hydrolase, partial [Anaerolineae bacterium]|nr:glycoside hydrolase [Anaerolineae bacterium]
AHRIPSMSADSEGYNASTGRYWRGGVWPAMNMMVLRGLRTAGQHKLVHKIAMNHLQNVHQVFLDTGAFWENYAPESAAPGDPAEKDFIGPTGLTPITLLLEDVIGISVEWPHRRVYFDRRLPLEQTCGVRNYPVGPEGTLALVADGRTLTLTTDTPLTLVYRDNEQNLQTAVSAGTTKIDLS